MVNGDSPPTIIVDIIPNPAHYQKHPYRVRLTDDRGRTIKANFELDLGKLEELSALEAPVQYGAYLYDQVFERSVSDDGQDVGDVGDRVWEMVDRYQGQGLRLKLKIATTLAELHAQAWECMYASKQGCPLATTKGLTLSRDVDVDQPRANAIQEKPNVLVAIDSPSAASLRGLGLEDFDVDAEIRRFSRAFELLKSLLTTTIMPRAAQSGQWTWESICNCVLKKPFNILHVSCHGIIDDDKRAKLVLSKANGTEHLLDEDEFANFFGHHGNIQLVVLDACFSGAQSNPRQISGLAIRLLQRGVPAVIGMQRTWYGPAGETFVQEFYENFSRFGYVDQAVRQAREMLEQNMSGNRWNWGIPVLYLRLGAGQLFKEKELTLKLPQQHLELEPEQFEPSWLGQFAGAGIGTLGGPPPQLDPQVLEDQLAFYQGRAAEIEAEMEDASDARKIRLKPELVDTQTKIHEYQQLINL